MKIESKTVWTNQEPVLTEATTSTSGEQAKTAEPPTSQNAVDTLETFDRSGAFFRADDMFHMAVDRNQLEEIAADLRKGEVGNPGEDSLEGFKLQDALQKESRMLSVDLPQQFTDSISELQSSVMGALDGDAAAMQEVQQAFGFDPQDPVKFYRKGDPAEVSAGDGGTADGGTEVVVEPGEIQIEDVEVWMEPGEIQFEEPEVVVEPGEIQFLDRQDPDAIFSQPSGDLTEAAKRNLEFGDKVDPDLQDVSAPQTSSLQPPGYGLTYTTPDVDDPTTFVGELKIPGPGGDPVDPDMQEEPPSNPNIPSNDPYTHEE